MPLHMNLTDPEDPGNWARFNEIPWFKIVRLAKRWSKFRQALTQLHPVGRMRREGSFC